MMLHHREVPPTPSGKPDFSRFLCSQVWVERSGMPLSVVSALARLNLDPSREALSLATVHRTAAAIMLAHTIARLPDPPATIDMSDTAVRLIKLLPDSATVASRADPSTAWWIRASRTWQLWVILVLAACVIYLALTGTPAGNAKTAAHGASSAPVARAESGLGRAHAIGGDDRFRVAITRDEAYIEKITGFSRARVRQLDAGD